MKTHLSLVHKTVSDFIQKKNLIQSNDNCLIAVSGGADSVVALDLIYKLKKLLKIDSIAIAHVNYNLRGNFSIEESLYVKNLAEKYKIPFYLKEVNLANSKAIENNARNIRYSFFEEICKKHNYNKLIVAHNSNDQAETVLIKLIKGTVTGIKGIEVIRDFSFINKDLKIIRPLLCLSRNEIESYCNEINLEYKTDLSNFENDYTRNRVRNTILPLIFNENPNFLNSIQKMTTVFSEEEAFIKNSVVEIYKNSVVKVESNLIILDEKEILINPDAIIRRLIKYTYEQLLQTIKLITYNRLDEIVTNIRKNISSKYIELGDNLFFYKDRNYLVFSVGLIDNTPIDFEYDFCFGSELYIKELDISFNLEKTDVNIEKKLKTFKELNSIKLKNYNPQLETYICGKEHKQKLKDFFDKKKLPNILRKKMILLFINDFLVSYFY